MSAYRRVLLKLSGEALTGDKPFGIDPDTIRQTAGEIAELAQAGVQPAIVVGGGNIFRGASLIAAGVGKVSADHMGMLATAINALALGDALRQAGLQAQVMSAVPIPSICENYTHWQAIEYLENGRATVFAAGTGSPFFTTDSAASLRAIEIGADLMIKATKVNGVYSDDPVTHADAVRYSHLRYDEVIARQLAVMDISAVVMCRDHQMPMRVINMTRKGALMRAVMGEDEGTLII